LPKVKESYFEKYLETEGDEFTSCCTRPSDTRFDNLPNEEGILPVS
jgi:hypothetical protein